MTYVDGFVAAVPTAKLPIETPTRNIPKPLP